MKLAQFAAITLLSVVAFTSKVQAAPVPLDLGNITQSFVTKDVVTKSRISGEPYSIYFDHSISGSLAPHTNLVFTFTSPALNWDWDSYVTGTANGVSSTVHAALVPGIPDSRKYKNLTMDLSFSNLLDAPMAIKALFSGELYGNNKSYKISASVSPISAVPLPPAILLFASGVIGLLGYSKRKNQTI